jgi:hypothetical protein
VASARYGQRLTIEVGCAGRGFSWRYRGVPWARTTLSSLPHGAAATATATRAGELRPAPGALSHKGIRHHVAALCATPELAAVRGSHHFALAFHLDSKHHRSPYTPAFSGGMSHPPCAKLMTDSWPVIAISIPVRAPRRGRRRPPGSPPTLPWPRASRAPSPTSSPKRCRARTASPSPVRPPSEPA